jgi:hypothetical protein
METYFPSALSVKSAVNPLGGQRQRLYTAKRALFVGKLSAEKFALDCRPPQA